MQRNASDLQQPLYVRSNYTNDFLISASFSEAAAGTNFLFVTRRLQNEKPASHFNSSLQTQNCCVSHLDYSVSPHVSIFSLRSSICSHLAPSHRSRMLLECK